MKRLLKVFLKKLDPHRIIYLQNEVVEQTRLDDAALRKLGRDIKTGDLSFFAKWANDFKTKILRRDKVFLSAVDALKDRITGEAASSEWTRQMAQGAGFSKTHGDRYRRLLLLMNVRYHVYRQYLDEEQAYKYVSMQLKWSRDKWTAFDVDREIPKMVMACYMSALDPHSAYFDAARLAKFKESMARDFCGIGIRSRGCPLGAHLVQVFKDGPAGRSNVIEPGDTIINVDGKPLSGLQMPQISKRLRGAKGSELTLTLKKAKPMADGSLTCDVTLTRDTVTLSGVRVTGKSFETDEGLVVAVALSNFYSGVTDDVVKRIEEHAKGRPIAGLILDFRNNSGGLVTEAIKMAGLFIGKGPVMGTRNRKGRVRWLKDTDGKRRFDMPVVILINQFTVSAPEVVSGALLDYGCGIIVGSRQTHGKGSVQYVQGLKNLGKVPGSIKITAQQYFRAGGSSVQGKGVPADITLPGPVLIEAWLERNRIAALPWAKIPTGFKPNHPDFKRYSSWKRGAIADIKARSAKRVARDTAFDVYRKVDRNRAIASASMKDVQSIIVEMGAAKDRSDPWLAEAVRIAEDVARLWKERQATAAKTPAE